MSKLALLGGTPVFDEPLSPKKIWPPIDDTTEERLVELYRSRKWTAFDEAEPKFASAFAAHHGARHGIFMVNGTVTLQCALGAYGIGPGDEVIVPPLTWYATAMAVHYVGAVPVFVDIQPDTWCIDPQKIEAAITPRTKAIILVHALSSVADMDRIMVIARQHDLRVIEDSAHAHGGTWDGKGIGSIGDVGSFSFQHSKTMACGEGGICTTNDDVAAERIFRMKQIGYRFGQAPGHATDGPPRGLLCYQFRATAFHPTILHPQLLTLDERLARCRSSARYLETRLSQSTRIRFQGRPAKTREYNVGFMWGMLFNAEEYAGIPTSVVQKALTAEGVPVQAVWHPTYRFVLFNLNPEAYRIDDPCTVTEHVSTHALMMSHAILGIEKNQIDKIADAIEKVTNNMDDLRNS